MDHIDKQGIEKQVEECQSHLSGLYHYLMDVFIDDPPDIVDKITELQRELTNFVGNELVMIEIEEEEENGS